MNVWRIGWANSGMRLAAQSPFAPFGMITDLEIGPDIFQVCFQSLSNPNDWVTDLGSVFGTTPFPYGFPVDPD